MNREIAQKTLESALKNGAQKARITCFEETQNTISVLDGEIDRIHSSQSSSLSIQLFVNDRFGSFSTNRMEEKEVNSFIKKSIESTKLLTPDIARTLPDRSLYYKGNGFDLQQFDTNFDTIDPLKKKDIILSIASEIDVNEKRLISSAQDYDDYLSDCYTIDSNGFAGESRQSIFSVSSECTVKGDGDARPQNYWCDNSIFFDTLKKGCGKKALQRALNMIGSKKIKSGKYNIILDNTVSGSIISPILSALSGASIQQKYSFLLDSMGKQIFSKKLSLMDIPHTLTDPGSRWFDGEGLATKEQFIINEGVVSLYFLSTYYGIKLSLTPTIDSLSVASLRPFGSKEPASMMKELKKGVFITGLNGGNSNGATGDFSFGIEGFYFENGEIVHPVKEMNMTGNIISLLNNIVFIGEDPRECSRLRIPSISFENIDLNGI
jgi:PmbA protein